MIDNWSLYEKKALEVMKANDIAGAAIAVARGDEVLYCAALGKRDIAQDKPVTHETIFGVASISKSFTAMAIGQLVDEGRLSFDDPVIEYLPEFRLKGAEDMSEIKVSHILSHTTGLPPMTRRPEIRTFEQHMEYLATADYTLLGRPGEYFSYCNDTFLLNGAIIERLSGLPYRRYMTERILKPIAMQRATYDIQEVAALGDFTDLYVKNPVTKVLEAKPWVELGLYEVGGGVRSNVLSLLRYARIYTGQGTLDGQHIISKQSIDAMRTPMYKIGQKSHYAFGLQVTYDHHGVTLVEHGGGQPGVSSNFGFVPEKGISAVVLTNVTGVPASSLWLGAVNTALGLSFDTPRAVYPAVSVTPEYLEQFTGNYRSLEGADLTVTLEADGLWLYTEGEKLPLRPTDDQMFIYHTGGQDRTIKFYTRAHGDKAWAAFTHLRMMQRAQ